MNFKAVEDLAEVWCEWAEMEIRQEYVSLRIYRFLFAFADFKRYVFSRNYDEAIRVMQRAAAIPKNVKINYHDHVSISLPFDSTLGLFLTPPCLQSLSAQARLFKSIKLWSFYVDLEESIGTVESTKAVYDKILELRIANAQIIINYAAFLEENKYYEDSFKVSPPLSPSFLCNCFTELE